MSSASKPHSTQELLAEIRRGLIEMTDMPEAFDAFLKVERRVKELEEQLETEKKWGRNQADLLTDCATENERLKEQLEAALRIVDAARRARDNGDFRVRVDTANIALGLAEYDERYPAKSPDGAGSLVRSQSDEWTRSSTPPPPPREDSNQESRPE